MILTCPECATRYDADSAKFPAAGRKVRCAKCGHVWHQPGPAQVDETLFEPVNAPEPETKPEPAPAPAPEEVKAQDVSPAEAVAAIRRSAREQKPEPVIAVDKAPKPANAPKSSGGAARAIGTILGWATLNAVILVICFSAAMYRQQIVGLWPKSASLFAKLGMGVNARGLEFIDVHHASQVEDGQPVLLITGQLKNVSNKIEKVPPIRVVLSDDAQRPLFAWEFVPSKHVLAPGSVVAFHTRLSNPPAAARHVDMRLSGAVAE
jgi:predicted Zn finger-like uncharacterized protein